MQASINRVSAHNCWVCEGYVEVCFELTLPDSFNELNVESVFLHLEFENYEPIVMKKKEQAPMKKPMQARMPSMKGRKSLLNLDNTNLQVNPRQLYKQFSVQPPKEIVEEVVSAP